MTNAKIKKVTADEFLYEFVKWNLTHQEDIARDPVTMLVNFLVDRFGGGDEKLRAELMAERSGILNWILDGVQDLKRMGVINENMQ